MSGEEIPQALALKMQLTAIAGREPETSFFELRPIDPEGRVAIEHRQFVPVGEIRTAMACLCEQAQEFNAFVGVAPRIRGGGTAGDVERVWCLWADLDGRDALVRLRDFRPLPSIVIRSGSEDAAHAYWALKECLSPMWAQRVNRRLALALGADRVATDPARILRGAGTRNYKHSPPRAVVCTRLELDTFTWAQVAGGLPDDREYRPAPRRAWEPAGDPSRLLASIVDVVAGKQPGERNHALFWAACRVGEHVDAGELDEADSLDELRAVAAHVGLTEHEIEATIRSGLASGRSVA